MTKSIDAKRADFRKLHASGCFVLPNPWDVGSARLLAGMGFKALASTSSGFAWSAGYPDNDLPVADVCAHLKLLSDATDLPVNADFEAGFADDPEGVAANVTRGARDRRDRIVRRIQTCGAVCRDQHDVRRRDILAAQQNGGTLRCRRFTNSTLRNELSYSRAQCLTSNRCSAPTVAARTERRCR